jgi:phenylacetic acid degradation operon negative regulatory protein
VVALQSGGRPVAGADPTPRPQTIMLTFLGEHLLDRAVCVYSGSIIGVLARVGISDQATRSTLTRMAGRGLLRRQRHGQRMYFGLTARSAAILRDGAHRLWRTSVVNDDWDGTWTLLSYSLPGSHQRERHDLRSQLGWAGFGSLQGGLWIAPGEPDVEPIVAGLGLASHVRVFRVRADGVTDVGEMVADAYDLSALAARYADFLTRWEPVTATAWPPDPLAAKLRLVTDWLQTIRRDPRLPVQHLPPQWPAARAQELFHRLNAQLDQPAHAAAAALLDTMPDTTHPPPSA